MEDDLNFNIKSEDELNLWKMKDNLIFRWKMTTVSYWVKVAKLTLASPELGTGDAIFLCHTLQLK